MRPEAVRPEVGREGIRTIGEEGIREGWLRPPGSADRPTQNKNTFLFWSPLVGLDRTGHGPQLASTMEIPRMKRTTRLAAAALTAALALPAIAAGEGEAAASLDAVSVVVDSGSIIVTGTSSYNGAPVVVGTDAAGDATMPGSDFGTVTMTQGEDGLITAELQLLDGFPETATSPEGIYFEWNIDVPGGDAVALTAKYVNYNAPGGWFFAVTTYTTDPTTGSGSFSSAAADGEYNGSALVWRVSPAQLGASAGDKLLQGSRGPIRSSVSGAGLFTFTITNFDDMLMDKFVVGGGARVIVRDAAGEEVEKKQAKVRRGSFSAAIADLPAGTYTVEVITEYGDASASETFTVTI